MEVFSEVPVEKGLVEDLGLTGAFARKLLVNISSPVIHFTPKIRAVLRKAIEIMYLMSLRKLSIGC